MRNLKWKVFYWLKISIKLRLDFKVFDMYDVNFDHFNTKIPLPTNVLKIHNKLYMLQEITVHRT